MKRLMTAVGMIVSMILGMVVAGSLAASNPATDQVCPAGDGWYKYGAEGNWEPEQPVGINASIGTTIRFVQAVADIAARDVQSKICSLRRWAGHRNSFTAAVTFWLVAASHLPPRETGGNGQ